MAASDWTAVAASLKAVQENASDAAALDQFRGDAAAMDLYSRQIATYGVETMVKLRSIKVLIVGLRGVGIEAAKNLALAGVGSLTLYDPNVAVMRDVGVNFFIHPEDAGKPRAATCAPRVAELNPSVQVKTAATLDQATIASHDVVVVTIPDPATLDTVTTTAAAAPAPIKVVVALAAGAVASIFCDFGLSHRVNDPDGEIPVVKLVTGFEAEPLPEAFVKAHPSINPSSKFIRVRYMTPEGQAPGPLPDDGCEINGLSGCTAKVGGSSVTLADLSTSTPLRAIHVEGDPVNTCRLGYILPPAEGTAADTKTPPVFVGELDDVPPTCVAYIAQKKIPISVSHRRFADAVSRPTFEDDLSFTAGSLHAAVYGGLVGFMRQNKRLPIPHTGEDIDTAAALAKEFASTTEAVGDGMIQGPLAEMVDEVVVRRALSACGAELQPVATYVGAVAAQEVVKAAGKYRPVTQFLYFNLLSALPLSPPPPQAQEDLSGRYGDLVSVYGKGLVQALQRLKVFMVGCGALGCEFVKNFALLGVCCGGGSDKQGGKLIVTDNDRIEVSNLNRQFLFREENVGAPKSATAGQRAKAMNSAFCVDARQDLVGPATEHIYNEDFWLSMDVVVNALDNMQARLYVDSQCVFYEVPLLDSGTSGPKGNVDVVVPHMTASYADGGDADDRAGVPMCTIRNFPHLIEHCIEWARAVFEDVFANPALQANKFASDPEGFIAQLEGPGRAAAVGQLPILQRVRTLLELATSSRLSGRDERNFVACFKAAHDLFFELFRDPIKTLTHHFPRDAKTKTGDPFWSGHKKFPTPFEEVSLQHADTQAFVIAAANLFASVMGLHPPDTRNAAVKSSSKERWMAAYREPSYAQRIFDEQHFKPSEWRAASKGDLALGAAGDDAGAKEGGDDEDEGDTQMSSPARAAEESTDPKEQELDEVIAALKAMAPAARSLVSAGGQLFGAERPPLSASQERIHSVQASQSAEPMSSGIEGGMSPKSPQLFVPAEFEKDDDDNFHIDFIAACANLRASNYSVPTVPREKVKEIAGRIVPAIATTTAAVTGLVMLELIKVLDRRPIDDLLSANISLALNQIMAFSPADAKKIASHVEFNPPDPAEHPDAYDADGKVVDMYKDPDMGLGFANRISAFPDPHTKYDKIFVGGVSRTATVSEVVKAIESAIKAAGLDDISIDALMGPTYRKQDPTSASSAEGATADERKGIHTGSAALCGLAFPTFTARFKDMPLRDAVMAVTSKEGLGLPPTAVLLSDPVDINNVRFFNGLTVVATTEGGASDLVMPPIVLVLEGEPFVPYAKRPQLWSSKTLEP